MEEKKPRKPYGKTARILALIAALFVLIGTIFVVFQPGRSGEGSSSVLPTAYAAANTEKPWKDLKKGASGPDVKRAQQALAALGFYDGKQDGNFSKVFEEAVLSFQKDWGLAETGVIDRETFETLTADLPEAVPEATPAPSPTANAPNTPAPEAAFVVRGQSYTDKEHVAAYLKAFGELPPNYITKQEAQRLGWVASWGNLDEVAPGKSIGGDRYGNYEGKLPAKSGRRYFECDIGYDPLEDRGRRNGLRLVYSSDGLIFYTGDHYNTFEEIE